MLALDTGARRGEITGLIWEDIDLNTGIANINKTTQYVSGYGTFEKRPKTETSNRTICITATISLLIQGGVQPQIISKRAGHSSVGVTHQIYSHFFDEEFKDAASKMDDFLNVV